jgi:hypothetical protein
MNESDSDPGPEQTIRHQTSGEGLIYAPSRLYLLHALGSKIRRSDCAARRSNDHDVVGCARRSLDDRSHRAARRRMAISLAITHRRGRWPHLDGRS